MSLKYRRDIDGLRSLAIIPVVLYHLKTPHTSGGFVGVDIFFVISGYLITSIISGELKAGRFSIQRFYERRARRIFPALFTVLAACLIAGYFVFLPNEFADLGQSIISTTLFVSNFFFAHQDSYFSPSAEHELLLHTWSLAVEEQFYLLFPIILALLSRLGGRFTGLVLWVIALCSFALNVYLLKGHPTDAFYLPFPRAWELMLGALLAIGAIPPIGSRWLRECAGAIGLALIGLSIVLLEEYGGFAGPAALAPCVGAVLLILAGASEGSFASRALGNPVCVYIGKISYSLYLWHWPIIVVYRLVVRQHLGLMDQALIMAVSIAAAAASTQFIERPFRKSAAADVKSPAPPLFLAAGVMAISAAIGLMVMATNGLEARFPANVVKIASYLRYGDIDSFRTDSCFLSTDSNDFKDYQAAKCLAPVNGKKNYLLLGDSHAAQLWAGLVSAYPDINFMQATVAGCPPLLVGKPSGIFGKTCRDMVNYMLRTYIPAHRLDGVILSRRWAPGKASEIPALQDTIRYIRRYDPNVYVVGPIVEYTQPLPRILAFSALNHRPRMIDDMRIGGAFALDSKLGDAVRAAGGTYVSMVGVLCHGRDCATQTADGGPLQFDDSHLTEEGSRLVAQKWNAEGAFEVSQVDLGGQRARH